MEGESKAAVIIVGMSAVALLLYKVFQNTGSSLVNPTLGLTTARPVTFTPQGAITQVAPVNPASLLASLGNTLGKILATSQVSQSGASGGSGGGGGGGSSASGRTPGDPNTYKEPCLLNLLLGENPADLTLPACAVFDITNPGAQLFPLKASNGQCLSCDAMVAGNSAVLGCIWTGPVAPTAQLLGLPPAPSNVSCCNGPLACVPSALSCDGADTSIPLEAQNFDNYQVCVPPPCDGGYQCLSCMGGGCAAPCFSWA